MYNLDKGDPDGFYEKLKNNKFSQQQLPAWRPVPNMKSTVSIFITFGIILIIIGAVVFDFSLKTQEISIRYDDKCFIIGRECRIVFEINTILRFPILFSYQMSDFYQNLRMYTKSKSDKQLSGEYVSLKEMNKSGDCFPATTNSQMGRNTSVNGTPLNESDVAIPCGLIAKSYFNDTFTLIYKGVDGKSNETIWINQTNIAWPNEKRMKYENIKSKNGNGNNEDWKNIQWMDMSDEHFIVWMRPSPFSDIRKLWGRIEYDLFPGKYEIIIMNNFNVTMYEGTKTFVLSAINAFGGNNNFLGFSYVIVGGLSVVIAFVMLIGQICYLKENKNQKKK